MTSDSDRLLAAGVPLRLAGGGEARLRLTFRSLKMLEDHFGSINAAAEALDAGRKAAWTDLSGPVLEPLGWFLAAALQHDGVQPEQALELLDPTTMRASIVEAYGAFDRAWEEAFPPPDPQGSDDIDASANATTAGSPGETSTGSPSASPDGPTSSSGR